ncbi:MAG: Tol-Pal system beta propeller repeat protein TolB [Chromatiales bacterium]|nr:Tol-Pal system beta propeller repeat protein TolB [Chromatiales bacterium]
MYAQQSSDDTLDIIVEGTGDGSGFRIAVAPFHWTSSAQQPANAMHQIVLDDLVRSGRFVAQPMAPGVATLSSGSAVNFARWAHTTYLAVGDVSAGASGDLQVRFRLFDVTTRQELRGLGYQRSLSEYRITAHDIADEIYETVTTESGAFSSRLAYITEQRGGKERIYSLNVADSDGYNANVMLQSRQPIMSPSWSPDGNRLAYVSFEQQRAQIWVQELSSRQRYVAAEYPGLNQAPAFSPDGTRLAMALSKDGNAEIYVLHLRTKKLTRLTNHAAIDTEPAWRPDGRALVFTSGRSGSPQIYQVSANGGPVKRVTFEGAYNAGASYSPDATRLAVVHRVEGGYGIAVYDIAKGTIDVLSKTRRTDSPSFAPNGAMVLYSTKTREGPVLMSVSANHSGATYKIRSKNSAIVRDPAWGPRR